MLYLWLPDAELRGLSDLIDAGFGEFLDRDYCGVAIFNGACGPDEHCDRRGALATIVGPRDPLPPEAPPLDGLAWCTTWPRAWSRCPVGLLGIDPAEPPQPESLSRKLQYAGYSEVLGDGNQWLIPVVAKSPLMAQYDGGELFPMRSCPAMQLAERLGVTLVQDMAADPSIAGSAMAGRFNLSGARALAEYALQLNYRGRSELWELLGLLSTPYALAAATVAALGLPKFAPVSDLEH
ncbi:MAG TPA: hypothetical protein PJ982_15705 [Lacipirellulaceae bacterium]|nr:hypothetical protein [Lacipirellulaceae bacterium]